MKKMYPAVVNSPKTELPESITSTQTDITVSNASVLLAGEGIATIGNGDTAETITYTSVDGNVLKGCIRGYQGVARSWTAGTRVARNFAAADWDTARDNITELAERLDTPERASITLQPGVRVVDANQDAAFKLAGLQGRTVLNYQSQIGIYGVLNPYVIRYGQNLLPPFYEAVTAGNGQSIISPYSATINASGNNIGWTYKIPCVANTDYTISLTHNGMIALQDMDSSGAIIQNSGYQAASELHIKTAANAAYLSIVIGNGSKGAGVYSFSNPMLNISNTALPFKPRQDSMLAFQTELHANPDTGANPDTVFERDGQYFKLAKWKRVVMSESLTYGLLNNYIGFKRVTIPTGQLPLPSLIVPQISWGTKYDGALLKTLDTSVYPDSHDFSSSIGWLISVSNTDSGWGDSYTPTADEIKAYFMGWKMYQEGNRATPYTSGTKQWFKIQRPADSSVASIPTDTYSEWTPYQLLYQLATPVVEPITSEGQLTFVDGDNQVEVGTGIVLREGVKPALLTPDNNYYINSQAAATKLAYKVSKFLYVYANSRQVYDWLISTNADSWGAQRLYKDSKNFNSIPSYSVTYLMLDKYPTVDVTGTYAENEKALLLDTVKTLQDNTTRISVLESKKAEKDSPAWITPTLLNGASQYVDYQKVGYLKDSFGFVHLKGLIATAPVNSRIFILPVKYRPAFQLIFRVAGAGETYEIRITSDGGVFTTNTGNYISLDGITFQAEH
ncbi:hypothetical protein [Paenibacillus amylolyticus]|uniref:hypothetical protein n=1 Tax=Paenibacillus amylolyticus TaxID=1451 RepID=UPI001863DF2E|nr:hypothetical protein [Paenibacillus amylolyticus]